MNNICSSVWYIAEDDIYVDTNLISSNTRTVFPMLQTRDLVSVNPKKLRWRHSSWSFTWIFHEICLIPINRWYSSEIAYNEFVYSTTAMTYLRLLTNPDCVSDVMSSYVSHYYVADELNCLRPVELLQCHGVRCLSNRPPSCETHVPDDHLYITHLVMDRP